MRRPLSLLTCALLVMAVVPASLAQRRPADNPNIDMRGFLAATQEAAAHRATRLLTEAEFMRLAAEPGTIVLDARSKEKYDELHVEGAINLSFPDITVESLQRLISDKTTRVLIYCNNNFRGAEGPFPSKLPSASLNLSTYVTLFTYGYRNVYELGEWRDLAASRMTYVSTKAAQ